MKQKIDFLAVGDTLTDAFIELQDAEITKDANGKPLLTMPFGAKIPYKSVTILPGVGNAANAAVAAKSVESSSTANADGTTAGIRIHEEGAASQSLLLPNQSSDRR
jgi:hypothetical protein